MLKIGIVGLAQAGKTTFFRIVTKAHGAGLASGKPAEHVGVVSVPDSRLDTLSQMFNPRRTAPASIEYVDTAGSIIDLARAGAQSAMLREVQALAHVIRAFDSDSEIRLLRDLESVEVELILSDLAQVEKRVERLEKDVKKMKNPALDLELQTLLVCKEALESQQPLRELNFTPEQQRAVRGFTFLSLKPVLYILNLSEKDAARTGRAEEFAAAAGLR
ncbi:MAG: redox-regulated ATPase YchF, partial [Terriglobia bacterium]